MESGDEGYESEEMTESRMNEGSNDPACVPDEDDEDYSFEYDSDDDSDDDDSDDEKEMPWDYGKHFEGKKSRKTMKESKERKISPARSDDTDFEKLWDFTFSVYPKKSGAATA